MMHLRLLRDGITPLRSAQHDHSHDGSLTWLLTPSAPIASQRGQVCLIIDLARNHCLLAVCQTQCWREARPQMESKSLCRSYSTSATGPRCWTFTYTERLSNLHWQRANTEHLQHLREIPSAEYPSNTHFPICSHMHICPDQCSTGSGAQSSVRPTRSGSRRHTLFKILQPHQTFPVNKRTFRFSLMMSAFLGCGVCEPLF